MADFIGFYLDGIHSSTYGILRVSDGDRYKEGLIPEFEDREIELSGGSGSIYVNTQYKKTPFDIEIAFDHLTEQQFRDMRKWLGGEKLHSFRFDERPYKTYWVKLESRPELEYVCFMEESDSVFKQEERIYKGEGTLNFVAYDPFGYCIDNSIQIVENAADITEVGLITFEDGINWQVLDSYTPFEIIDNNVDEWGIVSGLKTSSQLKNYNKFFTLISQETREYTSSLYNPGDFDADFELMISFPEEEGEIENYTLTFLLAKEDEDFSPVFQISLEGLDYSNKVVLNSKKHSLSVYKNIGSAPTSVKKDLRYDLVKSTDWFKIPTGESRLKIECARALPSIDFKIKYNYKYY